MAEAHTQAVVLRRPPCDLCDLQARYDGRTHMGPWAFMCELCFATYGIGLGLGMGQRLLTPEEVAKEATEEVKPA